MIEVCLVSGDIIATRTDIYIFYWRVTSDVHIAPDSFLDIIFSVY